MTTQNTNSTTFVTTPRGSRIPKNGTLAYHPSIGFCDVVGRVGERVRVRVTDFSEATDVVLTPNNGETIEILSRQEWMARVAEASENSALLEIDGLDARLLDESDGLFGAPALVKQLQESIISRTRGANEMLVAVDGAEAIGWEFDDYMTYTPKRKVTKAKAPAPRPFKKPASNVGTLEDPTKPDWLVAEMNEAFGDMWTPASTEPAEQAARS
jgi:hypothetical protein